MDHNIIVRDMNLDNIIISHSNYAERPLSLFNTSSVTLKPTIQVIHFLIC